MLKRNLGPGLASLLAFCWMFFFFHNVFRYPNAHLLKDEGDGMKAFYVFADHIKNDASYHQQRNMNYPYGQTFVFTDGQPAIANAFKLLSRMSPYFSTHCIALYNYLILLSFVGCAFFIARILQRFNVSWIFAGLGGFCIAALSPQIWRMTGHPTMAYAIFFPLSWYLLLRLVDSGFNLKHSIIAIVNTTFWFFVHPYLGMVITFFYAAYIFFLMLTSQRKRFTDFRSILAILLVVVLPLGLLKVYSFIFDHHLYRPEIPFGFWNYFTEPRWVFLPHSGLFDFLLSYFKLDNGNEWDIEKLNYIGFATDIILVIFAFRILRFISRRKFTRIIKPVLNESLLFSGGAAIALLLLAMCIPFKWGLESVVDHIGFIRQFRSLGRFAWAFYYVATVFGVYGFYLAFRFLKMKGINAMAWTLTFFFFSVFILEAYPDVKETARTAVVPANLFNAQQLPEEYKSLIAEVNKNKDAYQCIVPLPFFHVGSDNYVADFTEENLRVSSVVSYWCNMPLMASSAARSPILEARNIMQFFSPGYIKKIIQNDLPDKRDFLVLYDKEYLNTSEQAILNESKKLFDNGKYELWSLPYDRVFKDKTSEYLDKYKMLKDSLITHDVFQVTKKSEALHYNSYDVLTSEFVYKGNGALRATMRDFSVLYESDGGLKPGIDYTVSFWYYNKGELRGLVLCVAEECNADGSNCRWDITWDPRTSMVIDGDWSLIEKTFQVKEANEKVKILVKGKEDNDREIFIDELLLRESSIDVYAKKYSGKDGYLFYNNNWISTKWE